MRVLISFLLSLCAGSLLAGEHIISDCRVAISLPNTWQHDTDEEFGYMVRTPSHSRGLKIRLRASSESDLLTTLNEMIQNFEWFSTIPSGVERREERVIGVKPVVDADGREGLRVISGTLAGERHEKVLSPTVFHYLFVNSDNRVVCVCLYAESGITEPTEADAFVLKGLRVL